MISFEKNGYTFLDGYKGFSLVKEEIFLFGLSLLFRDVSFDEIIIRYTWFQLEL
jgi:hypothetical protein